ncbi:long chain fatty acid transporter [Legionella birminghamensis]|uniref:Long chain fatty acid transporter n=1 Tax=Legionella birminghamensis TaxID=28083 RepID=A0A378I8H7_9GAMM|nr:outer membrane protein transport protein [Legionella birminghamensis]KTC68184.1 long chain fatty acid transporter [Legionella birminghamensis]STX31106.1 long chain fatty acid transporter [Legionella birminghamensis]
MKSMQKPIRTMVSAAVISMMAVSAANAGAFSLYTESAGYVIGNYAAGAAAEAADASTGWYNPAGLALLHNQQVVTSGVGVFPSSKLSGTSTFRSFSGLPFPANLYIQSYNGVQGANEAFVPAFHYALPITDRATFGLSVVSPFGLSTEWDRTDPMRYQGTFSELITTNVSPEIGGMITDNFSLGAGIDLQYARVKFNSVLGVPTVANVITGNPFALDSPSYNKGNSFGVGFHAGAMYMFNDNHSRIGLNYQSKMNHTFHGYSRLSGPFATPGLNLTSPLSVITSCTTCTFTSHNLSSNNLDFPDIVTLSGYHDVNDKLALLGSVVYTGWSTIRTIELRNVAAFSQGIGQVKANSISSEYYDNAWRAAIGANYKFNDQWMLRVGGGYDQTPTTDANRTVRLPDADRWALSVGGHYQWRSDIGFDAGWTHLFAAGDPTLNKNQTTTSFTTNVNATAKVRADLVGLQATWTMDQVAPVVTK